MKKKIKSNAKNKNKVVALNSDNKKLQILPLKHTDLNELKRFTDKAIGTNYYSLKELEDIFKRSQKDGKMCTLVLKNTAGKILGVRITFPPTQWKSGKGKGLTTSAWKTQLKETAYFQSLFIDLSLTGKGYGKKMSLAAMDILRKLQAKAVVTHSWKESPNDSSGRYLRSLGFELVATHPFYWKEVDYVCTRCGKPCLCTAEEMIKYL